MICNRATAMDGAQLLQSGGEISVNATMNGQQVALTCDIGFMQTKTSSQPMQMFWGFNNNGDSVMNWLADSSGRLVNLDTVSNLAVYYGRPWVGYVFDSTPLLEYTNCDAFWTSDSPKTSVSVVVPDASFNPNNTDVYLILPSINCAMSTIEPDLGGDSYKAATNTITLVSETETNIVPVGMAYELVVIANKNGQYYYYTQTGTISHNGLVATAILAPETQSYVNTQLQAL